MTGFFGTFQGSHVAVSSNVFTGRPTSEKVNSDTSILCSTLSLPFTYLERVNSLSPVCDPNDNSDPMLGLAMAAVAAAWVGNFRALNYVRPRLWEVINEACEYKPSDDTDPCTVTARTTLTISGIKTVLLACTYPQTLQPLDGESRDRTVRDLLSWVWNNVREMALTTLAPISADPPQLTDHHAEEAAIGRLRSMVWTLGTKYVVSWDRGTDKLPVLE
jgi:hypothetical protein